MDTKEYANNLRAEFRAKQRTERAEFLETLNDTDPNVVDLKKTQFDLTQRRDYRRWACTEFENKMDTFKDEHVH